MKRIFLSILILLPLTVYSAPVSESICRKVAASFLESRNRICDVNSLQLINGRAATRAGEQKEYYIFNTPGKGFVIISGDDSVLPVIGYSPDGEYIDDDSMTNFKHWMGIWSDAIRANRKNGLEPTADIKSEWGKYTDNGAALAADGDEILLETALWAQGDPYNMYCPQIGGGRAVTGCVATAIGILMKYFEWPVAGKGTLPGYTHGSIVVQPVELGEEYDWKNMPMSLSSSSSDVEKHAVATLLYHVGVSVKAMYGESSTGAYSQDVREALVTYMDYDRSAILKYAKNYSKEEWVSMIKNNIKNVGPLLYGGVSDAGGHQFLVTGYDADDRFYINWGWGGANNGYYSYPGFSDFIEGNDAIFNLKKNCGGETPASINLIHRPGSAKPGISLSCINIEKDIPFTAIVESFQNAGDEPFEGELGIARVSSGREVIEVLGSMTVAELNETSLLPGYYFNSASFQDCTISSEPGIGEKLMGVFRAGEGFDWSVCSYDRTDPELVGEILLADPFSIEQSTSLVYLTEGKLKITSKNGVTLNLLGPNGEDLSSVVSSSEEGWEIDITELSPADYKLQLSKDDEFKEITVKMGLKK